MNYNRNNYADTMWKQFNPQVISIDNIATNQIFDFTQ